MFRIRWALVGLFLLTTTTGHAATRSIREVLVDLPPGRLIELRLVSDDFVRGFAVAVRGDTALVRTDTEPEQVHSVALADIALVREWRSDAGRGAGWGAASGAMVVGAFGLLMGAYVSSIDDSGASDLAPVMFLGLAGAAVGATAGAVLGLGMGALAVSWHEVWPDEKPAPTAHSPTYSEASRLGLFAGTARPLLDGFTVSRLATRVSLRKSLGDKISLGPEISFHKFEGARTVEGLYGSYQQGQENLLKIAFTANLRRLKKGITPYATTGLGWFLSNDAYLGAHAGGGLRWQFESGNDLEFDLRYHFNLTDVDRGEVDRFWTIGLGLGFDL